MGEIVPGRDLHNSGVFIGGGNVSGQIVSQSSGTFTQNNAAAAEAGPERPDPSHPGPLRILYMTATSYGDLRVDEEVRRVLAAVRAATNRDRVRIEHAPAAIASDLLDGLTRVRPHIVHFSGHADGSTLAFDSGSDRPGPGRHVTAELFAVALGSVDTPPALVVLNACRSAAQLTGLLASVPVAIGMRHAILDSAGLVFAARFYRSVADGQSVGSAYRLARTEMGVAGQPTDLPILAHAPNIDPNQLKLAP